MRNEIAVICHNASLDCRNGYGYAFEFYRVLAKYFRINIKIVTLRNNGFAETEEKTSQYMTVKTISVNCASDSDNTLWSQMNRYKNDSAVKQKLYDACKDSIFIICEGIYFVSLAKAIFPNKKVIYRSLDIEYDKICYFRDHKNVIETKTDEQYKDELNEVFEFEMEACRNADLILALTEGDAERINSLYEIPYTKIKILPICVKNADIIKRYIPVNRQNETVKRGLLISNVLIEDTASLITVMRNFPEIEFHIIGRCGYQLKNVSPNVVIHGRVSDEEKNYYLEHCDFAINISHMTFGMNVKVIDYISSGIPMISNKIGVRGYELTENAHYILSDFGDLEDKIRYFCSLNCEQRYNIVVNAYNSVISRFDYEKFMSIFSDIVKNETTKKQYYIFGAGTMGKQALNEIPDNEFECVGFTDNNLSRHGTEYCGKLIYPPEEVFRIINNVHKDCYIVIAMIGKKFYDVLEQTLSNVNIKNIAVYDPEAVDCFVLSDRLDCSNYINRADSLNRQGN
ncbi:MAG: glycosyltransferase [Oscillospiraceae bacterium]